VKSRSKTVPVVETTTPEIDSTAAARWRLLNAVDAQYMFLRWRERGQRDPLTDTGRFTPNAYGSGIWTVKSDQEVRRLVGALQYRNQRCTLWFRGEGRQYDHATPARYRSASGPAAGDHPRAYLWWLRRNFPRSRTLRDRSDLGLLALLQHYGVRTSMLDVTRSFEVAMAFAFQDPMMKKGAVSASRSNNPSPTLCVFATPRVTDAVSDFPGLDLCVVDLMAEFPSDCLRPHSQQAGFLARRDAIWADIGPPNAPANAASTMLDGVCIARLHLDFKPTDVRNGLTDARMFTTLFPKASTKCCDAACPKRTVPDFDGDYALHILKCAQKRPLREIPEYPKLQSPNFAGFPSFYW